MNRQRIRATVLDMLGQIAPEADSASIDPRVSLRDQLTWRRGRQTNRMYKQERCRDWAAA